MRQHSGTFVEKMESRGVEREGPLRARFGAVYLGHSARAAKLARNFATDTQDAEDAVQEAFLWLWLRKGNELDQDPARLLAVVVRRLSARSSQRRMRVRLAGLMEETVGSSTADATTIEERDEVATLLGKLDREERDVVRMRYLEGHSCNEVAKRIRVAPGTVHSRLFRALAKLRVLVGGSPA
jgi:RNA polymerase sigma factor (sigma-70 family)